jgi:hypothetical protein
LDFGYSYGHLYIYKKGCQVKILNSNTLEPDWPQHELPVARVIAQQYSSTIFVVVCPHSRKGKFGDHLKGVTVSTSF